MPIVYDSPDADTTSTIGGLVEEVMATILGGSAISDAFSFLTKDLSSLGLDISVDDVGQFSRGIAEIDEELVQIVSVDVTAGTLKVSPRGRGFRATPAAPHTSGSTVTMAPTMARSSILRAINHEIRSLFPGLFGIHSLTFLPVATRDQYALPADADVVLDVRYQDSLGNWERIRAWELEADLPTDQFPSARAVRVPTVYFEPVRVTYGSRPQVVSLQDDFTDTGLPQSCRDLVMLGTLVRLLPSFDIARLSTLSVEAVELNATRQVGTASILVRELKAQYAARLAVEQLALKKLYPARIHITR